VHNCSLVAHKSCTLGEVILKTKQNKSYYFQSNLL